MLVRVHSLDLCQRIRPFLLVQVHQLDLCGHSIKALTVVNKGTVVCRRIFGFQRTRAGGKVRARRDDGVCLTTVTDPALVIFHGDSDALLVRGIVALLVRVLSGHSPKEIVDADLYFIDKIGLQEHLSPTRNNGVVAMLKQMRLFALAYLSVIK